MALGKLNRIAVFGLVMLVSAAPQAPPPRPSTAAPKPATAPTSGAEDLAEHPEILMTDFNPKKVTIYGVKVGDKTAKVPVAKMDRLAGTLPGIMKLQDGYQLRYNPTTLTVTALVVGNRVAFAKAELLDRYDVEFRFGKPDISDDRHVIYLSRRMLVTFNNQDLTAIEVR